MNGQVLMLALGLVLIVEGIGPLLFPKKWQLYLAEMARQPAATLQRLGAGLALVGAVILIIFS
ncbi:DUF2065 domain-containing protein [Shewanella avicenniae]|uniref:DUF2065 domain-containing protein n=1 Tax=Shewanella avicenniae TaxID=2814294 RepID=A0ABX7QTT9_9GAMM|nr:DUF2065 domain-containing protein [Shewanella avicenniae]QSX34086.1 DUF2065 domain-containing protein [Shewanella avicenniae]